MTTTSLDPRARWWGNFAKWGFLIIGCAVLGPIFWLALGGFIGLVAFGSVVGITWMLRPFVFTLAASTRIKLMKTAAAINPVENLQAEHRRWGMQLDERAKGIQEQHTANREFKTSIDHLAAEFPDDQLLPQMRQDYEQLIAAVEESEASWKLSYAEREELARAIERASRLWASALSLAKARGASRLSASEWESQLKTVASFDTIRQRFDAGIAGATVDRMKLEAARASKDKRLPASATGGISLNVTPSKTQA